MTPWSLYHAKNEFSAVVDAALAGDPQQVTRHGKPAMVVLAAREYERLRKLEDAHAPAFSDFLLEIPQDEGEFARSLTDLLIAATALERGLTVVTRNVRRFRPTGVRVVDPSTRSV